MEMAEQDLCEGRSSVAVHHCIRQLSYCRRDIRDSAGVWGEVSVAVQMQVHPILKRPIELEPVEVKSLRHSTTTGYFLHFCPHQLVNAVYSFSQGKGMLLVLQDRMLNLIDPDDHSLLHSQPISSIRVWGVGRDHDRSVMMQT